MGFRQVPGRQSDQGLAPSTGLASRVARRKPAWWRWLRRGIEVVVGGAGVYALFAARHQVAAAAGLLGHLAWPWLVAACAAELASMGAFARIQSWLLRAGGVPLGLLPMVEITLAGNALSVSLPGGVAWGTGYAFEQLRRRGADRTLALWVVLAAGALDSFALFVLIVVGVWGGGATGPARDLRIPVAVLAAIPVGVVIIFVAVRHSRRCHQVGSAVARAADRLLGGAPIGRRSSPAARWSSPAARWSSPAAQRSGAAAQRSGAAARRLGTAARRLGAAARRLGAAARRLGAVQPRGVDWAVSFGFSLANWVYDCACLVFCMLALGIAVPWRGLLVAYCLAQVSASLPLTPGGIGIVEGSMSLALIAYGLRAKDAVAVVLLYRIISFWALVPIGWGAWGLLHLRDPEVLMTVPARGSASGAGLVARVEDGGEHPARARSKAQANCFSLAHDDGGEAVGARQSA